MNTPNIFNFKDPPLRTKDGRFCTKEQHRQERIIGMNEMLKFERDKYFRAWQAAAARVATLEREIKKLKANEK